MAVSSADMPLGDILMSSNELLERKEIDCGGFGKVFLCCHRHHGLVVLKTMFTGYKQQTYKQDLLKEGEIMRKLNHKRVVKLLGVILEDGNYSLVIEYMPKGNLLSILKQTAVPVSVKARFIMEIIEGMIYLHSQNLIHKDLKPENILADDDFHVKIADLGASAFQKWSTLTKEETNRQKSKSGRKCSAKAGTLSYMAPEHFKDINHKATGKSDVYSFGIVIWVILNDKEPYENGINDNQLSLCVKEGQRPSLGEDTPSIKMSVDLMQECWKDNPAERPTFKDCEKQFRPVYSENYEKNVMCDVDKLRAKYPAPEAFIERMASLQLDCDAAAPSMPVRDLPQSLHSLGHGNVDETLFRASNEPEESEEEKCNDNLHRKLQEEMNYHQTGSRMDNIANPSNTEALSVLRSRKVFNEPCETNTPDPGILWPSNGLHNPVQPAQMYPAVMYEYPVQSPQPYTPFMNQTQSVSPNQHQRMFNPYAFPMAPTTPESGAYVYEPPEARQSFQGYGPQDFPKAPIAESAIPGYYQSHANSAYTSHASYMGGTKNIFPKGTFGYSMDSYTPDKSVNLTISNSRAIQIGNNNYMTVEASPAIDRHAARYPTDNQYQHLFGSNALLNEQQFKLLRENLSKKWKEFARKVGFREPEIEEIDHDYERDGLKEKVFQMLHKWQMKEGSKNSTVGKIAKALYALGEIDLLNQLKLNCANT